MTTPAPFAPLAGIRILSLALNLPGPAALARCRSLGALCTKLEPPPAPGQRTSDPMHIYSETAYNEMHEGIEIVHANLKTEQGQDLLHRLLAHTDVLLTSFRPKALPKLGLEWEALHAQYPQLCMVQIVGAPGERANEAGHDLTYQAEAGLLPGLDLPATAVADMSGALCASEAVCQTLLARERSRNGACATVSLAEGAQWMAAPIRWGMMSAQSPIGGKHVGYRIYPCADGRVALAALEAHFALNLWRQMHPGQTIDAAPDIYDPAVGQAIAAFLRPQTRAELDALSAAHDIPLYTLPPAVSASA